MISSRPASGRPKVGSTAATTTSDARGTPAIPLLLTLAKKDSDANVRYNAAAALNVMGEDAIAAEVELLESTDMNVLQTVLYGLQQHREKSKAAVPTLIKLLKGGDKDVRWLAAQTLGQIGRDAKDAIGPLEEALKENDPNLKWFAQDALQRIKQ